MDFETIGRARMMIRLPGHRGKLRELSCLALTSLIESYGVAVMALEDLRKNATPDERLIAQYEYDCQAFEEKVVRLLSDLADLAR